MLFNLISVSSMILIGLSNQHVLGRFITGPIRLSNHHGAREGNSLDRRGSSKIDSSQEKCQTVCLLLPWA